MIDGMKLSDAATAEDIQNTCGWQVRFADILAAIPESNSSELETFRGLNARTTAAHEGKAT